MSREKLQGNLKVFCDEMAGRLAGLSPEEQQQYLEGVFHLADAMTRYANPKELNPFERENFIGSIKAWVYSEIFHLGLDSQTRMKPLIETDAVYVALAMKFAANLQEELGISLTFEEQITLNNVTAVIELLG